VTHERKEIMGDSGEGLIDAEARIHERMEELQANREQARRPAQKNPEEMRQLDSLRLARTQLTHQLEAATHKTRRKQIADAIGDIDHRIARLRAAEAAAE
jgi:hypothetical protein